MARVDYDAMAKSYDAGRAMPLTTLSTWRAALAEYVQPNGLVLDLGSGTGIFSAAFATWFAVPVVGVEPSAGMRACAARERSHPLVRYVAGSADGIPMRTGSCAVAWLSTVIHHVRNLDECAHEVRRVLASDGAVLIRSAFAGRLDHIRLFRYFPQARAVAETFPSVEATEEAFAATGLTRVALTRVDQEWAPSLRAYVERVRLRADSTLAPLTDAEFAEGLRKLECDAANEAQPTSVIDGLDLLVLAQGS